MCNKTTLTAFLVLSPFVQLSLSALRAVLEEFFGSTTKRRIALGHTPHTVVAEPLIHGTYIAVISPSFLHNRASGPAVLEAYYILRLALLFNNAPGKAAQICHYGI